MTKRSNAEVCREQYAKHREKRLAAKKAQRDADPEAARAYQRAMYAKHREKRVAEAKARRDANREELAAKAAERYHAGGEELKARRRELAKAPHRRAKQYELQRRWFERNPEKKELQNAKVVLAEQVGCRIRDIPDEIAWAKVEQLRIGRWAREQLAAQKTEAPNPSLQSHQGNDDD